MGVHSRSTVATVVAAAALALSACNTVADYEVPDGQKVRDDGVWYEAPAPGTGLALRVRARLYRDALNVYVRIDNAAPEPLEISPADIRIRDAVGTTFTGGQLVLLGCPAMKGTLLLLPTGQRCTLHWKQDVGASSGCSARSFPHRLESLQLYFPGLARGERGISLEVPLRRSG